MDPRTTGRRSLRTWSLVGLAAGSLVLCLLKARGSMAPEPPDPRRIAERFLREAGVDLEPLRRPGPLLVDVAEETGLRFVHDNAARGRFLLPELLGSGAGLLDYDGDGDLDVFLAGGGAIIDDGPDQACRLYRNDSGTFTDVTDGSGAGVPGPAYGVACADVDNDGDEDIYVARLGANRLLVNMGDGTFREQGGAAGVDDDGFGSSVAFLDYDRDGWLDLYVTNYVDWSIEKETECYSVLGERDYCSPSAYESPARDVLYRNLGDGRFEDVSHATGISREAGQGLGVLASDFDDDGWIDILVANDRTPGILWHNLEGEAFEDVALVAGVAYDIRGVAIAGMGIACEDLDGDRDLDVIITNIRDQMHLGLINEGGRFDDRSTLLGLGAWSIPATGFGIAVFDQDHDGHLDGYVANGHVVRGPQATGASNPYDQADEFFRLQHGRLISASAIAGIGSREVSRAVARGDLDGDGDLDLVVTVNGGPALLLRNENASDGHWLIVDARLPDHGRRAIGARVTVETRDATFVREIRPHESYLSSSDPRAHFGLGDADRVDRLTIRWPDGTETVSTDVPVDRVLVMERGEDGATEERGR